MSSTSFIPGRGKARYVLASACVLAALVQIGVALMVLRQPAADAWLSTADGALRARVLLPAGIAVCMELAAGLAVYMMRVEALACMGCLLARLCARMVDGPVPLVKLLDLSFFLILTWFMVRLFARSATSHASAPPGRHRPRVMLLVGLAFGHLTVLANDLPAWFALVSTASVSLLAVLGGLFGCGALYAAAAMLQARPQRAATLFVFAALALALSLLAWGGQYAFAAPFWLGVPVAILGVALARNGATPGSRVG